MKNLNRILELTGAIFPAVLMAILLLVIAADVFARIVIGTSISAAHDIAILALAGVVWFGVVGSAHEGQLFGVRFFVDRLPERAQSWMTGLVHVVVILIALQLMRSAILQASTSRFTQFLALGWPKWIVSAGLAAAMFILIVIQCIQLGALLRSKFKK